MRIPGIERNGKPLGLDEEYLRSRFEIFYKYCFPSVSDQICKEFDWVIFFDKDTPKSYIDDLSRYDFVHPVLADSDDKVVPLLKTFINSRTSVDDDIITTRLDNDDNISIDFIKKIQDLAHSIDHSVRPLILNPIEGLCFDIDRKVLTRYSKPSGPFISLLEKRSSDEEQKTVFYTWHDKMVDFFPSVNYHKTPLWMQIIHDSNRSNALIGRPVFFKEILDGFPSSNAKISWLNTLIYSFQLTGRKLKNLF